MIKEVTKEPLSGWNALAAQVAAIPLFYFSGKSSLQMPWLLITILFGLIWLVSLGGFFTLQPNEARVLVLFGQYKATVRKSGFHWMNPLFSNGFSKNNYRYKISLRSRTFLSQQIKVNDKSGNPIEIAMMVVWKVADSAKALFQVDNYREYVETQAESALRHVASQFPYDHKDGDHLTSETTLRGNPIEISQVLQSEMSNALTIAGIEILDTRLTHLAYAPEIAQSMLRRQQAEAVIAARKKIVAGAVGMVEMALRDLEKSGAVILDDDKKATMVSNMMLVLVGDRDVTPVINTGTLYS